MTNLKLTPTLSDSNVRYQFICRTCDISGNWTNDHNKSQKEADDHSTQHPGHDVDIIHEYSLQTYNNFIRK